MTSLTFQSLALTPAFRDPDKSKFWLFIFFPCNIPRKKGNKTIKFGQLIEHNIRNAFLGKSYTKCVGKTSFGLFYGNCKLSVSLDQPSKMLYSFFVFPSRGPIKYNKTEVLTTCFYPIK